MKRTRNIITAGSRLAASALAFGLAVGTAGCGASPGPLIVGDKAAGADDQGRAPDETAWAEQGYPATWAVVRAFMREDAEFQGRSIHLVTALHRPGVEGPAYLHFALRRGSEDAGYIVASTGGHDAPIHSWSFTGSGEIRSFEERVGRDLSAARVFLVGVNTLVAELSDGPISSDGSPLLREDWEASKPKLVNALEKRRAASRERIVEAWQRAARVSGTDLPPDVLLSCPTDGCGGDPCLPSDPNYQACICGGVSGTWRARGGPPPEYVQFFSNWWNGSCKSGCTPTAFAQIMGWIARQSGSHQDASAWGHPRMSYAYANGSYVDSYPPDYTEWYPVADLHETFETTCDGQSGPEPVLAAG